MTRPAACRLLPDLIHMPHSSRSSISIEGVDVFGATSVLSA
jgi:hypothetical protein